MKNKTQIYRYFFYLRLLEANPIFIIVENTDARSPIPSNDSSACRDGKDKLRDSPHVQCVGPAIIYIRLMSA